MRWRRGARIRLDSVTAVPQLFSSAAQASVAALIMYTLSISMGIIENPVHGNRIGRNMQVSNFMFIMSLFKTARVASAVCGIG